MTNQTAPARQSAALPAVFASLAVPTVRQSQDKVAHAQALFRRTLCAWTSDLLVLRRAESRAGAASPLPAAHDASVARAA